MAEQDRYRASTSTLLIAAAGTAPFFEITGSATRIVRVTRVVIMGTSLTLVEYLGMVLDKNSTQTSGGTATNFTMVPIDSASQAATIAAVRGFTAAPTAGTVVGAIASTRHIGHPATAGAAGPMGTTLPMELGEGGRGIVLRGSAETLTLRFAAAPASAVSMMLTVDWIED